MSIRTDVTVDFEQSPRVITVASPSTSITIQDLHDTLVNIEDSPEGGQFPRLVSTAGKEPLGGGVLVGLTMTLQNAVLAFEARPGPTYVQCTVSGGNLVAVDDVDAPISPILPTAFTQVVVTASSSATLQELEAIQYSSFDGMVHVDVTSTYSGTEFPVGTPQQPVNNISDAVSIANARGIDTLHFMSDVTLDTGDNIANKILMGRGPHRTHCHVETGASITSCEYRNLHLEGILDGGSIVHNCSISDITNLDGHIEHCTIDGVITLGGMHALMFDCSSGDPGTAATINFNGNGTELTIRHFDGSLILDNKSGAEPASIDMSSGDITINSNVTAGTITLRGVSALTDNSVGATIAADDLLQPVRVNEQWKIAGLDKDNPMTVTTSQRTTGGLTLNITGNGQTTSTVTRQ